MMYEVAAAREKILPAQLERRVYERLREDIASGFLRPGDQLVEARLASDLGVSKTPVREALIRLERDGLVEIEPYRGARVLELSQNDVRETLELRELLECHVARQLAATQPPALLEALEATVTRGRAALEGGDGGAVAEALTEFGEIFTAGSPNSRLVGVLTELQERAAPHRKQLVERRRPCRALVARARPHPGRHQERRRRCCGYRDGAAHRVDRARHALIRRRGRACRRTLVTPRPRRASQLHMTRSLSHR